MISIIIPVYNVETYLIKCLDSCFTQTYTNLEVIAINDGSTDNSGVILDNYSQKEPRLKVIHQENKGVAVARQNGLKIASGEWIMFVDSDDYIAVNSLEILLQAAYDNQADIVVGGFDIVNQAGTKTIKHIKLDIWKDSDRISNACRFLKEQIPISLCGKIFHRSLFDNVIHESKLKIGEDAYVELQLINNATTVCTIEDVVYYYVQRKSSVTHTPCREALLTRLLYITLVISYYTDKQYNERQGFDSSVDYFLINECFGYLRMGGHYDEIPETIKSTINNRSLNNSDVVIPMWRIIMLKCYKANYYLGQFYRFVFINLRSIYR